MSQQTNNTVPLSRPDVSEADIQAVVEVLRGDRLSMGPRVVAFEQACARRTGLKHGVAVNSGTSGLHLCVRALGLAEGDEVITTSFSFVASTNCLLYERVKPVYVDIDPVSYNMDPAAVAAAITPRTRAILPVEIFGNTAHFDRYEQIAREHNLPMIEDSCEALGGALQGRPAGSFGQCGVFAFYPNKQITTGEGGMIVTDDDNLADLCRSMRNQGRKPSASAAWLSYARLGYNYRMDELSAALGEAQMSRLDAIVAQRRDVAERYNRCLSDIEEIHLPPMADPATASWFIYVIRLNDRFSGEDRARVMEHLRGEGIGCDNYFEPIHQKPHVQPWVDSNVSLPMTDHVASRTLALPFFNTITPDQMRRVKTCLQDAIRRLRTVVAVS
jgi:perosamine synthetase